MTNPTFTRAEIDQRYSLTLTDTQWQIVLEEVEGKDSDQTDWQVIDNTIADLDFLEEEYAWWQQKLDEAKSK